MFSRYLSFNIGVLRVIHKLQTVSWADDCITENSVESPSKRKAVLWGMMRFNQFSFNGIFQLQSKVTLMFE